MRIVTVLILLVLGLALYLANSAPNDTTRSEPRPRTVAVSGVNEGAQAVDSSGRTSRERARLLEEARTARFADGLDRSSGFTPEGEASLDADLDRVAAEGRSAGAGDNGGVGAADADEGERGAAADLGTGGAGAVRAANPAAGDPVMGDPATAEPRTGIHEELAAQDSAAQETATQSATGPVADAQDSSAGSSTPGAAERPSADAASAVDGTRDAPGEPSPPNLDGDRAETTPEVALAGVGGAAERAAASGSVDGVDPGRTVEPGSAGSTGAQDTDEAPATDAVGRNQVQVRVAETTGAPLGSVGVRALDAQTGTVLASGTTDASGLVLLNAGSAARVRLAVDAASVPLGVAAPIGQDVCRAADDPPGYGAVCAEPGARAQVELPLSSGIQGKVVDANGRAVAEALVRAIPRRTGYQSRATVAATEADGSFFIALVPGDYELQVLLPDAYGSAEARARRLNVRAEEGAARLLETIDYREAQKALQELLPPEQSTLEQSSLERGSSERGSSERGSFERGAMDGGATAASAALPADAALASESSSEPVEVSSKAPLLLGPAFNGTDLAVDRLGPSESSAAPAVEVLAESVGVRATEEPTGELALERGAGDTVAPVEAAARPQLAEAAPEPEPLTESIQPAPRARDRSEPRLRGTAASLSAVLPGLGLERTKRPSKRLINPSSVQSKDPRPAPFRGSGGATLIGRVQSRWGEAVDGLHVVAQNAEGREVARAETAADGTYELRGVPAGVATILVAPGAPLGSPGPGGSILRARPEPLVTRSLLGEGSARLDDVVVDIVPLYRIAGQIVVDAAALKAFRTDLVADSPALGELNDAAVLRVYLRGLRLSRRNKGGAGRPEPIQIESDGSFAWRCNLPSPDVVFVLESRTHRPGVGYGGPVGVEVTPAGVRTAQLELGYPAQPAGGVSDAGS